MRLNQPLNFGLLSALVLCSTVALAQLPEVESIIDSPDWERRIDDEQAQPDNPPQSYNQPGIGFQPIYNENQIEAPASFEESGSFRQSTFNEPDTTYQDNNYTLQYQSEASDPSRYGRMNAGQEMNRDTAHNVRTPSREVKMDESNPMLVLFQRVDTLMQEVQELRGKLEEQNFIIQNLQDNQKALYLDVDKRIKEGGPSRVGGLSPVTEAERNQLNGAVSGGFDTRVSSGASDTNTSVSQFEFKKTDSQHNTGLEQEIYQKAYLSIQNKDYDAALSGFKSLVKQYPGGHYAPNAYYWMGEIYLVQGELDLASHAFDEVYQEFPRHAKAADALLKLGYVEYAKGEWHRSKSLLTQVKNQFPGSTSARLADTRLQRMYQEGRI